MAEPRVHTTYIEPLNPGDLIPVHHTYREVNGIPWSDWRWDDPDMPGPGAVIRAWAPHRTRWWHVHAEPVVALLAALTGLCAAYRRHWLFYTLFVLYVAAVVGSKYV